MMDAPTNEQCPICGAFPGPDAFCVNCSVSNQFPDSGAYAASRRRRLAGTLLENLLIVVTLVVGWLVWLRFTAETSQSPAKRLLGMYILSADGSPATAGRVWLREVGVKLLLFGVLAWLSGGISILLDAIWIFRRHDRQTLHDRVAGTLVVWAPKAVVPEAGTTVLGAPRGVGAYRGGDDHEARLRELRSLVDQGLITETDYERRRRQILDEV